MKFKGWLKRRWQEFRWGHGIYLTLFLSFMNFLLISYRFLIEYVSSLKFLFPRLHIYAAAALLVYIPLAIIVGHLHRKRQLKTDISMVMEQNPYIMEILKRVRRIEKMLEERGSNNDYTEKQEIRLEGE